MAKLGLDSSSSRICGWFSRNSRKAPSPPNAKTGGFHANPTKTAEIRSSHRFIGKNPTRVLTVTPTTERPDQGHQTATGNAAAVSFRAGPDEKTFMVYIGGGEQSRSESLDGAHTSIADFTEKSRWPSNYKTNLWPHLSHALVEDVAVVVAERLREHGEPQFRRSFASFETREECARLEARMVGGTCRPYPYCPGSLGRSPRETSFFGWEKC